VLQYEKLGYTLGYRDPDKMRNYLYDAVGRVNRVCNQRSLSFKANKIITTNLVEYNNNIYVENQAVYMQHTHRSSVGLPRYNTTGDFCCVNYVCFSCSVSSLFYFAQLANKLADLTSTSR